MSNHHEMHRARRMRERSLAMLVLFALMVFVVIAGIVLAVLFLPDPGLLFRGTDAGREARVSDIAIGETSFAVPDRLVLRIERSLLRHVERLELSMPSASGAPVLVAFTAEAPQKRHEDLLEDIYRVYFTDRAAPRSGLQVHGFRADSPYADSELIVDYRESPPVAMRCGLEPSLVGPKLCDRAFTLGSGISVRLRFARAQAVAWKQIDGEVRGLIATMTAERP